MNNLAVFNESSVITCYNFFLTPIYLIEIYYKVAHQNSGYRI